MVWHRLESMFPEHDSFHVRSVPLHTAQTIFPFASRGWFFHEILFGLDILCCVSTAGNRIFGQHCFLALRRTIESTAESHFGYILVVHPFALIKQRQVHHSQLQLIVRENRRELLVSPLIARINIDLEPRSSEHTCVHWIDGCINAFAKPLC